METRTIHFVFVHSVCVCVYVHSSRWVAVYKRQCVWETHAHLCKCLQWRDKAAVLDLDVGQISHPVAAVERHLGVSANLLLRSFLLQGTQTQTWTQQLVKKPTNTYQQEFGLTNGHIVMSQSQTT